MLSTTNTVCAALQNCTLHSDYNILCFSFFFLPRLILMIVYCSKLNIIHLGFFFYAPQHFEDWICYEKIMVPKREKKNRCKVS